MTDFQKQVARFGATDAGYIVDVLRGAYRIVECTGDEEGCQLIQDFMDALDDCDSIELVDDEEFLVEN